jgi:hypothetical protein
MSQMNSRRWKHARISEMPVPTYQTVRYYNPVDQNMNFTAVKTTNIIDREVFSETVLGWLQVPVFLCIHPALNSPANI